MGPNDDPYAHLTRVTRTPRTAPVTPPVADDPYAHLMRVDSLATHAANTTVPEQRPLMPRSFSEAGDMVSRVGTAAKGIAQQAMAHPWDTAMNVVKGLGESKSDLQNIIAFPTTSYERTLKDTGGDARQAKIRLASAAMLPLSAAGRALGLGAKTLAGIDFAASAGFGAAQSPDDPGVGALLGLGMNALPYAPSALREVNALRKPMIPSLDGVTKGLGESAQPIISGQRMVPDVRTLPNDPVKLGEAFDAVATLIDKPEKASVAKALRPDIVTRRPQQLTDATRDGAAFNQRTLDAADALKALEPEATPRAALGFSKDGTYSAGADAPLEAAAFAAPARRPNTLLEQIISGRPDPRAPLAEILDNPPRALRAGDTVGQRIAANADAITVPPNPTPTPASNRTFREGFQTPDPDRPTMAVPQGDLPAKLFNPDTPPAKAEAPVVEPVPVTGESLNPALDAAVKTWRAGKLRESEVQRRFGVVQQFQAALDATNGNVAVAMDAVDSNKDRGLIRLMMGETPKAPRATLKAGEAPIVPGNPEGTTKLGGGKSVDYRGYTDEQLAAELNRNHKRVVEGMEMVGRGQWTRDLDDGVGGVVSGQTREAGRGKANINQATRLLDAAERELRVRYQRQGLTGEALEEALVTARFGSEAPIPIEKLIQNADAPPTGNTDFDFGANVGKALDDLDDGWDAPPAAPVAAAIPAAAPVTAVAPAGTPASVAAPSMRPELPPSKDGAINWRTWLDAGQPGGQSVQAIMQKAVADNQPAIKAARGYESMAGTSARANVAATEFFKDLVDGDAKGGLDYAGIRTFVEQYGEAGVPALKQVVTRTASVIADASKVLADANASADDVLMAQRVIDSAMQTQDQLLSGVVKEQARVGRSLNALKIQAKLSVDPDVWMVHAKRALGDTPMTDDVMANVRRMAREAADACGGG